MAQYLSTQFGGGGGVTIINNTDNYVLTATGTANTINGEANLQFNGTTLTVTGNVIPGATTTYDLGSSTNRWNVVYTGDLSLKNAFGDYTLVEGSEDLFLYNNKTGRVFKFMLQEVDPSIAPPKKDEV